jgi:hypothetical protein
VKECFEVATLLYGALRQKVSRGEERGAREREGQKDVRRSEKSEGAGERRQRKIAGQHKREEGE